MSRTVIDITPTVEPWAVIDAWAKTSKFAVTGFGDWGRTYRYGDGFWKPMVNVQIEAITTGLRLTAWVPFWGFGGDFSVHDLDPIQYFPRKKGQKLVNRLLAALGVPTI